LGTFLMTDCFDIENEVWGWFVFIFFNF
jgi:hypothetical protein